MPGKKIPSNVYLPSSPIESNEDQAGLRLSDPLAYSSEDEEGLGASTLRLTTGSQPQFKPDYSFLSIAFPPSEELVDDLAQHDLDIIEQIVKIHVRSVMEPEETLTTLEKSLLRNYCCSDDGEFFLSIDDLQDDLRAIYLGGEYGKEALDRLLLNYKSTFIDELLKTLYRSPHTVIDNYFEPFFIGIKDQCYSNSCSMSKALMHYESHDFMRMIIENAIHWNVASDLIQLFNANDGQISLKDKIEFARKMLVKIKEHACYEFVLKQNEMDLLCLSDTEQVEDVAVNKTQDMRTPDRNEKLNKDKQKKARTDDALMNEHDSELHFITNTTVYNNLCGFASIASAVVNEINNNPENINCKSFLVALGHSYNMSEKEMLDYLNALKNKNYEQFERIIAVGMRDLLAKLKKNNVDEEINVYIVPYLTDLNESSLTLNELYSASLTVNGQANLSAASFHLVNNEFIHSLFLLSNGFALYNRLKEIAKLDNHEEQLVAMKEFYFSYCDSISSRDVNNRYMSSYEDLEQLAFKFGLNLQRVNTVSSSIEQHSQIPGANKTITVRLINNSHWERALMGGESAPNDAVIISAGLSSKYSGIQSPKSKNPISLKKALSQDLLTEIKFKPVLASNVKKSRAGNLEYSHDYEYEYESELYHLHYYSTLEDDAKLKNKKVTFVCAGRGARALYPVSTQEDCKTVLVISEHQFKIFSKVGCIPKDADLLVVKKMQHPITLEHYKTDGLVARRQACFLLANFVKLDDFIFMDDNIESILMNKSEFNAGHDDWAHAYDYLQDRKQNTYCLHVGTSSNSFNTFMPNTLGAKLFFINNEMVMGHYSQFDDSVLLFPVPSDEINYGESYLMQVMFSQHSQAWEIPHRMLDITTLCIKRSSKNANAFKELQNKSEDDAQVISIDDNRRLILGKTDLREYEQAQEKNNPLLSFYETSTKALNDQTKKVYLEQTKQLERLKKIDLRKLHLQLHSQGKKGQLKEQSRNPVAQFSALGAGVDVDTHVFNILHHLEFNDTATPERPYVCRDYQRASIGHLVASKTKQMAFHMATGSGKSAIMSILAEVGYHALPDDQYTVIITPFRKLVGQFYNVLLDSEHKRLLKGSEFILDRSEVIKISSRDQDVNQYVFEINDKKKGRVFIVCRESAEKLFATRSPLFNKAGMIIADEYHDYDGFMRELFQYYQANSVDPFIFGFTATPPVCSPFANNSYHYSMQQGIEQGFLRKLVLADYTKELQLDVSGKLNQAKAIKVKSFLEQQYHPKHKQATKRLHQLKGIIYCNSIEECNTLAAVLRTNTYDLNVYTIHSGAGSDLNRLDDFTRQESNAVAIVVDMLKFGYDDSHLDYAFILANYVGPELNYPQKNSVQQIMGRLSRNPDNGVGLVLSTGVIHKYLSTQFANLPTSPDLCPLYRAQFLRSVSIEPVQDTNEAASLPASPLVFSPRSGGASSDPVECEASNPRQRAGLNPDPLPKA